MSVQRCCGGLAAVFRLWVRTLDVNFLLPPLVSILFPAYLSFYPLVPMALPVNPGDANPPEVVNLEGDGDDLDPLLTLAAAAQNQGANPDPPPGGDVAPVLPEPVQLAQRLADLPLADARAFDAQARQQDARLAALETSLGRLIEALQPCDPPVDPQEGLTAPPGHREDPSVFLPGDVSDSDSGSSDPEVSAAVLRRKNRLRQRASAPVLPAVTPGVTRTAQSAEVRRLLTRSVPVFDSEKGSIDTFLRALDCTLAAMGPLDPVAESTLLLRSLDERAQESLFAAGLDHTAPPRKLRKCLLRRFGANRDREAAADTLETVARGAQETILRFADRVAILARRAEVPPSGAIRAFLRGAGCGEFVRVINSQSLSRRERDALTLDVLCEKFESGRLRGLWPEFPSDETNRLTAICEVTAAPPGQPMLQPPREQAQFRPPSAPPAFQPPVGQPRYGKPPRPRFELPPYWKGRCFRCCQQGHTIWYCPQIAATPTPPENGNR